MAKKKLGSTKLVDEVLVTSVSLSADVTGTLGVTNGGTGQTSYTDGQLLIGNTSTGGLTKATLTQGTGVTITNGNGTITISSASSGTVNAGTANRLAYYASTGSAVSELGNNVNNGVLVTNGTGVPSIATDIPTAVTIGTQYIYRVGGTDVSVADGGTGLSSGTQGGILWYSASGTLASTLALTQYAPVVGGGTGSAPHSIAAGVGTGNQVLVSNGGTADPSWTLIGPNNITSTLSDLFARISFAVTEPEGTPTANTIGVTATAANLAGTTIASTATILELLVSDSATDAEPSATATFSSVGGGTALAGLGTSTLRVQTAATGTCLVRVLETAVASRFLWVKQGHGSQTWVRANAAPFSLTFA